MCLILGLMKNKESWKSGIVQKRGMTKNNKLGKTGKSCLDSSHCPVLRTGRAHLLDLLQGSRVKKGWREFPASAVF